MGNAFIASDYRIFARYTYPLILKTMRGSSNLVDVLTKTINDMKAQGMIFNNITFGEPSKVLKSGKELQATIEQHTEIRTPKGRIVSTSTLIAVSADDGNNWTFIDTTNKDISTLRKALPNLSPSIVIPPPQLPVRYNY